MGPSSGSCSPPRPLCSPFNSRASSPLLPVLYRWLSRHTHHEHQESTRRSTRARYPLAHISPLDWIESSSHTPALNHHDVPEHAYRQCYCRYSKPRKPRHSRDRLYATSAGEWRGGQHDRACRERCKSDGNSLSPARLLVCPGGVSVLRQLHQRGCKLYRLQKGEQRRSSIHRVPKGLTRGGRSFFHHVRRPGHALIVVSSLGPSSRHVRAHRRAILVEGGQDKARYRLSEKSLLSGRSIDRGAGVVHSREVSYLVLFCEAAADAVWIEVESYCDPNPTCSRWTRLSLSAVTFMDNM